MKAIRVKTHSARFQRMLRASCEPHTVNVRTIRWDDRLTDDQNHIAAAKALIDKIETRAGYLCGFQGIWVMGWMDNGYTVFVCNGSDAPNFDWQSKKKDA